MSNIIEVISIILGITNLSALSQIFPFLFLGVSLGKDTLRARLVHATELT